MTTDKISPVLIVSVLTALIFASLSGVISFFLNKKKAATGKKSILWPSLFFSILLGLTGLFGFVSVLTPVTVFILDQVFAIGFGIFAMIRIRKFFINKEDRHIYEFITHFAILAMGGLLIGIIYYFFIYPPYAVVFCFSVLGFLLPYCFIRSYELMRVIPPPIYKVWFYPQEHKDIDLSEVSLNEMILIEIEISKNLKSNNLSNLKGRTPVEIRFADYFASLVRNYNEKYPDDSIVYKDDRGNPYGWIFFIKPTSWGSTVYIDPDLTIRENKINEKHIIVSRRVIKN